MIATPDGYARLRHFRVTEFTAPFHMDATFLTWLDAAREHAGVPFVITSDWRSPEANADAGGWERSLHLRGRAVDLRWPASRVAGFKMLCGIMLAARLAPAPLQVELETGAQPHLHLGLYDETDGKTEHEFFTAHREEVPN